MHQSLAYASKVSAGKTYHKTSSRYLVKREAYSTYRGGDCIGSGFLFVIRSNEIAEVPGPGKPLTKSKRR
jgi:hypothetical protein